jgi:hypothetical protein
MRCRIAIRLEMWRRPFLLQADFVYQMLEAQLAQMRGQLRGRLRVRHQTRATAGVRLPFVVLAEDGEELVV